MQFYVAVLDDKLRDKKVDGPTIGLILCRGKNNEVVEYALRSSTTPIGVAEYTLPAATKDALAVEEIKDHLAALNVKAKADRD